VTLGGKAGGCNMEIMLSRHSANNYAHEM